MKSVKKTAVKAFSIVLALACLFGTFGVFSASAADYPTVFLAAETTGGNWFVGDVVPLKFTYFPAFNNEELLVEIYDANDVLVASADKTFNNKYGSGIIEYTVSWDTSGYAPGRYTVVVHKYFYSMYEWHEAPSTTKDWVTLKDPSSKYKDTKVSLSKTSFVYNAKVQKPTLTVTDGAGKTVASKYYTVKWSNVSSKVVGKYTVTVTFKSPYSGKKTLSYKIVPKKVTGLKNAAATTKSIKLSWTKVTGAKYYQIYAKNASGAWISVKTVETNTATITEIGGKALVAGKTYVFKVRGLNSTKKLGGAFSEVLKTGTKTVAPKITAITSPSSKTAKVTWNKVTGAKKYNVYKSTDNKTWTSAGSVTATSITLTDLAGGKPIYVKLVAVNAYGAKSAASAVKTVKVKK